MILAISSLAAVATATVLGLWALSGPTSSAPEARPYLGGGEAKTHAWNRFHFRAYTMTLVFIAFEMEMMFMYPWAVIFRDLGWFGLAEMGVFVGILTVGLAYVWRVGALAWE
mgnify:CR=1 FL=1